MSIRLLLTKRCQPAFEIVQPAAAANTTPVLLAHYIRNMVARLTGAS